MRAIFQTVTLGGTQGRTVLTASPSAMIAFGAFAALLFINWFGGLAVLAFLGFGALVFLRAPVLAVDDLARRWWILLVPFWCLLSTLWSDAPGQTLRHSVQLSLSFLVAIVVASRVPPRTFLRALWAALSMVALVSLLFGNVRPNGDWIGVFGSKNAFSQPMSLLVMASFALLLDRRSTAPWRIAASVSFLLGGVLLYLASSAGAALTTAVGLGAVLVLYAARGLRPIPRLLTLLMGFLAAAAVILALVMFRDTVLAWFLETTGKDPTLTGRTDLWAAAFAEIAERPVGGAGFNAFWIPGNPVAEEMWARFGIAAKKGFNFHNTWISNSVEIGVIGVALQVMLFLPALFLCIRWALRDTRAESVFFAVLMIRQMLISFVEVVAYAQFDLLTLLTIVALVYGLRARMEERAPRRTGTPRLVPVPVFRSIRPRLAG